MKSFAACVVTFLALVAGVSNAQDNPFAFPPLCSTVADTAVSAGLTSLVAALDATGLTETFANPGFIGTVFAPTDEAFANALGALGVTLDDIKASPELTATLAEILGNHVVQFPIFSPYFLNPFAENVPIPTLATATNPEAVLTYSTDFGEFGTFQIPTTTINGVGSTANIASADNVACLAVVHVIDNVLLPFNLNATSA